MDGIYILLTLNDAAMVEDCELFAERPTFTPDGFYELRQGNVNGGDSIIVSHNYPE